MVEPGRHGRQNKVERLREQGEKLDTENIEELIPNNWALRAELHRPNE